MATFTSMAMEMALRYPTIMGRILCNLDRKALRLRRTGPIRQKEWNPLYL